MLRNWVRALLALLARLGLVRPGFREKSEKNFLRTSVRRDIAGSQN